MKLTIRDCGYDWYVIERAEHEGKSWFEADSRCPGTASFQHSGRISDAEVEGTASEMLAIAEAIEERGSVSFRRCAVRVEGNVALFRSPRNSQREGICPLEDADELVKEIRRVCRKPELTERNDG